MGFGMRVLAAAAAGAFAAAAAVGAVRFAGLPPETAALGGAALFLLLVQTLAAVSGGLQRRRFEADILRLKAANDKIVAALKASEARLADFAGRIEGAARTRNEKLVAELRVLEGLVREFADRLADRSGPAQPDRAGAAPQAQAALPEARLLELVRRALEDNRVDLYLQPVVSLPQRKLRFFEVFTRLRAPDGRIIAPAEYLAVAESAGLMPVIDNLLLFRGVQLVRRLMRDNRDVGVILNISRHSLTDAAFFPQFLDFMRHNRDLAGVVTFEFAQEALAACGPREDANLRTLADLGFAFSMDKVVRLDLDFAALRERRVRMVKVPCETLLTRMTQARAAVQGADLRDLLARHGLSLVVEKVEREKDVVDLLDCNVDFGQGYLFGEPRPMRDAGPETAMRPAPRLRLAG